MAVTHDADSNANSGAGTVASLTWAHTISGANTLLVVGLAWTGTSVTLTDVKYNGVAMTAGPEGSIDATSTYHTQLYYLVNPTAGTNNIVATPSGVCSIFGGGVSFAGVDQSTPVEAHASSTGNSFGTVTTAITTANSNEMLVTLIGMANFTSTLSVVSGTEAFNQGNTTAGRRAAGEYQTTTSPGSYNGQWSISGGSNRSWAQQVLGVNEVGASALSINVSDSIQISEMAGQNLMVNGDAENAPTFVAATSTQGRWVDGSAAGSQTNDVYGWYLAQRSGASTSSAQFDTTAPHSGNNCLKLVVAGNTGGAVLRKIDASGAGWTPNSHYMPVRPSTNYVLSGWVKTTGLGTTGGGDDVTAYVGGISDAGTYDGLAVYLFKDITTTIGWTFYTVTFSTNSNTAGLDFFFGMDLIDGTAWIDDVTLYPQSRLAGADIQVTPQVMPDIQMTRGVKLV